jgi:FHS family L-fucose permease-like MFS transporter
LGATLMLRGGLFASSNGGAAGAVDAANGTTVPTVDAAMLRAESLHNIDTSFLLIAGLIGALALFIWSFRRRLAIATPPAQANESVTGALRSRWAVLGAGAIFLYVGAEVSVGSNLINFLHQSDVLALTQERAGKLVSLYWLGAMVGRFAGSALLARFRAVRLLSVNAFVAAVLCLAVSQGAGMFAAGCALAIGLFNSIMFPNIFALGIKGLGPMTSKGSGLIMTAVVGGAIVPLLLGAAADQFGIQHAFVIPIFCYLFIAYYGLRGSKPTQTVTA